MELLYETLASENCVQSTIVLVLIFGLAGAIGGGFFWYFIFKKTGSPSLLISVGAGAVLLAAIGGAMTLSGAETTVNISFSNEILEHKYCSRAKLHISRYPLSDIREKKYRKNITEQDSGAKRIEHYLDIHLRSRADPLSIQLSSMSGVQMKAAEKFAPKVMMEYQAKQ